MVKAGGLALEVSLLDEYAPGPGVKVSVPALFGLHPIAKAGDFGLREESL